GRCTCLSSWGFSRSSSQCADCGACEGAIRGRSPSTTVPATSCGVLTGLELVAIHSSAAESRLYRRRLFETRARSIKTRTLETEGCGTHLIQVLKTEPAAPVRPTLRNRGWGTRPRAVSDPCARCLGSGGMSAGVRP